MSPVLSDDRATALSLRPSVAQDDSHQSPLIAQTSPCRIFATFGHLADRLRQPSPKRPVRARPPRGLKKHHGIRACEPKLERVEVVAVCDPDVTGKDATLRLSPLLLRRPDPARLPLVQVEVDHRQAGLRR